MSLRGATICGVGSYLPETVLTNADWERMVDTTDEWIIRHTGISERRLAADDQASSDLAIRAAQRALDDADISPEQIGLIMLTTVTPDYFFPATACLVQDAIGAKNAG
ncbi:MAG: 3-oxoacyl-ACP synthase, partial [Armatimonadetes bacterium]|nr:3-oxoacyl-ACP synthase [Armatimonadota bacterium]